jgi:hypothetical protein
MANLANLLRLYSVLQRNRYTSQMDNMITSDGRITIPLKKMMMFADIVDDTELVGYDNLIRGPSALEFQRFLSVTWDRNYNNGCRKFIFDLTASSDTIRQILSNHLLSTADKVIEQTQLSSSPGDVQLRIPELTPSLKRPRISKIIEYSPSTLAKHSKNIEKKFRELLKEELPSSNSDLQNQVVKAFISRLEHDLSVTADNDVNNIIVSNIKDLITSVTKYGRNDREQIRFKEIIAVAVSGKNSLIKVMGATGLSRRNLDQGKKMRTEFEIETQKAMSEKSIQNDENNDMETAENTDDDDDE